jgi:signal transduction histidine kinase
LRDAREQSAASREILAALGRAGADPGSILDTILERAASLCRAHAATLYIPEGDVFRLSRDTGRIPEEFRKLLMDQPLAKNRSSTVGRAAEEMRTIQIPDVLNDAEYKREDLQQLAGYRTLLSTPMILQNEVAGVLSMWRTNVAPFNTRECELLEEFAVQGAIVMRQDALRRALESRTRELEIASHHKSEFLASMSHELRTPLNAVIGFSEVLLDRMFGEINERQEEYLRDIWNSGKHLLELLNEILDLSKVEAGQMVLEPSAFSVSSALDYCLAMVRERATAHAITVTVEVTDAIDTIEADELRFKQVLLNLLSNAVKFTPDGGTVTVRAYRDGTDLAITVKDTGIGVPVEDQERIFESFQQGRRGAPKEEGTGLGLTLSRRIVWLWGGRMWLESSPGAGSTFGFSIPGVLHEGPETGSTAREDLPAVLLVDDDRASLDLISAYLDGSPTRVLRAKDGVEALELVRKERPAAIVLEIGLPRLDGWQVLNELKADPATAAIPVVIATDVDDRSRGLSLGADAYLRKPIRREQLLDALRQVGVL